MSDIRTNKRNPAEEALAKKAISVYFDYVARDTREENDSLKKAPGSSPKLSEFKLSHDKKEIAAMQLSDYDKRIETSDGVGGYIYSLVGTPTINLELVQRFGFSIGGFMTPLGDLKACRIGRRILFDGKGNLKMGIVVKEGVFLNGRLTDYPGCREDIQDLIQSHGTLDKFFMCLDGKDFLTGEPIMEGRDGVEPLLGAVFHLESLYLRETVIRRMLKLDATNPAPHVKDFGNLARAYSSHSSLKWALTLINENENWKVRNEFYQTLFLSGKLGEIATLKMSQGNIFDNGFVSSNGEDVETWQCRIPDDERVSFDVASLKNLKVHLGNATVFDGSQGYAFQLMHFQQGFILSYEQEPWTVLSFLYDDTSLVSEESINPVEHHHRLLKTILPDNTGIHGDVSSLEDFQISLYCVRFPLDAVRSCLKEIKVQLAESRGDEKGNY
jgi:hypothetical protein